MPWLWVEVLLSFRGHVPLFMCSDLTLLTNQQRRKTLLFFKCTRKNAPKMRGVGLYGYIYILFLLFCRVWAFWGDTLLRLVFVVASGLPFLPKWKVVGEARWLKRSPLRPSLCPKPSSLYFALASAWGLCCLLSAQSPQFRVILRYCRCDTPDRKGC